MAVLVVSAVPAALQAEEVSLLADFEYFLSKEEAKDKETGIGTDSEFSRFSQLYQLDIGRFIYPNVFLNFGGYFEQDDTESTVKTASFPEITSENKETTRRPYVELNLHNPLYKTGLAYRKRETETDGSSRTAETVSVDEYNANLNWRPVNLPLLTVNYQRIELEDDPLTFDATRDTLNLVSKYTYKDFYFQYSYNSLDSTDHIEESGSLSVNHNGSVRFNKGFDYKDNRFDVQASAKYIYNTIEFTGANADSASVDTPAANPGSPFYIANDITPTGNIDSDFVDDSPLNDINIGSGGGFNPVSIGLHFSSPTDVDTIYIQLNADQDAFPNLATSQEVKQLVDANSFDTQVYVSDDQLDPDWTTRPSSMKYNSIDNRFEIRLASPVRTRQIKVTTVPLTLTAPGEIRYDNISVFTRVTGSSEEEPENFDQYYTYGLQWTPTPKTVIGYEGFYKGQDTKHTDLQRTSWTNGLFFRHRLTPILSTYGRFYHNERTETQQGDREEQTEQLYSLSIKANYFETLSQVLTYSGANTTEPEGSTESNFIILRTNADLYTGWSMNLDTGYAFNTLLDGVEQKIKSIRIGTTVEPNRDINISMDYTKSWTEETDRVDAESSYGTVQLLWALTDTLNAFFRYNFRDQKDVQTTSTNQREFNVNWAPFPDGTLHFSIGYNESTDSAGQEIKTISPTLTWQIARSVFLDLRYNTGTIESSTESSDVENIIAKLRIYY